LRGITLTTVRTPWARSTGSPLARKSSVLLGCPKGIAVPSATEIRGAYAIRVAIANHRSWLEDFELLVRSVIRAEQLIVACPGERSRPREGERRRGVARRNRRRTNESENLRPSGPRIHEAVRMVSRKPGTERKFLFSGACVTHRFEPPL
jgi:hypothetical protein